MKIPHDPKPRSEKAKDYIKRKNISEYDHKETIFCYLFEDMQTLIEKVEAQEKEIEGLKSDVVRARAFM